MKKISSRISGSSQSFWMATGLFIFAVACASVFPDFRTRYSWISSKMLNLFPIFSHLSFLSFSLLSLGLHFLYLLKCIFLLQYLFFNYFIVQSQLSAFSPHPSTPPQLNPPPSPTYTLPLDFLHVSFIVAPVNPFPHYPLSSPLWLLFFFSYISV